MNDVTRVLSALEAGDPRAAGELLPLVYDELRKLAAAKLAHERSGQTLQPTALVHEAYLRLVKNPKSEARNPKEDGGSDFELRISDFPHFGGRAHFFGAAAEAMRRILVENARRKGRYKHGGGRARAEVEVDDLPARAPPDGDLLALDEALAQLEQHDPQKARLVTLRYFGGLTIEQAADVLNISRVTAHRWWTYARAWLHQRLTGGG